MKKKHEEHGNELLLSYQYDLEVNMKITITEKERKKTTDLVYVDPCAEIECEAIDCNNCPLQATAHALREAQNEFFKVLNNMEIMG